MNRINIVIVAVMAVVLYSCSSGYTAYKKGDYYKASMEAIEKLRTSPNSDKAQWVLIKSYPTAVKSALRDIDRAVASNTDNNYDEVVMLYTRINDMAVAIYNCPKALSILPQPVEFPAELTDAKNKAAEQAYNMGLKALNAGSIEQARLSLNFLNKANNYVYGYKDVFNLIEEARYKATLRVVFEKPYTNRRYQLSADFFSNNLLGEISDFTANRFIRFYKNADTQQMVNFYPHQYLVLNFEDFSIGNIRETANTSEFKRDSVITGTRMNNGVKENIYQTVKAKYTTYRREIKSGGILSVRIIDANTNAILQQRNFSGEYVWYTTWASYNGDERALTNEQINACKHGPAMQPADQDMFIEFTKPIYSQAISYLKSIYR